MLSKISFAKRDRDTADRNAIAVEDAPMKLGRKRYEERLEPVSGRALPVPQG